MYESTNNILNLLVKLGVVKQSDLATARQLLDETGQSDVKAGNAFGESASGLEKTSQATREHAKSLNAQKQLLGSPKISAEPGEPVATPVKKGNGDQQSVERAQEPPVAAVKPVPKNARPETAPLSPEPASGEQPAPAEIVADETGTESITQPAVDGTARTVPTALPNRPADTRESREINDDSQRQIADIIQHASRACESLDGRALTQAVQNVKDLHEALAQLPELIQGLAGLGVTRTQLDVALKQVREQIRQGSYSNQ